VESDGSAGAHSGMDEKFIEIGSYKTALLKVLFVILIKLAMFFRLLEPIGVKVFRRFFENLLKKPKKVTEKLLLG